MTSNDKWKPCPPGTIEKIVSENRRSDRQALVTRRALFGGAAASVTGLCLMLLKRPSAVTMSCKEVVALSGDFVEGTLDAARHSLVEAHCRKCPPCARHIQAVTARQSSIG